MNELIQNVEQKPFIKKWFSNFIFLVLFVSVWLPLFLIIKFLVIFSYAHDGLVDVINKADDYICKFKQ